MSGLRGLGSLQELLGRNVYANTRKRKQPEATTVDAGQKPTDVAERSPLKEGNVRCPVCFVQIVNRDNDTINKHIDGCLSRSNTMKRKQGSLLQYVDMRDVLTKNAPGRRCDVEIMQPALQRQQQQQPLPPWSPDDDNNRACSQSSIDCIQTVIVGRSYKPEGQEACVAGCRVRLECELTNPRDHNAILVSTMADNVLLGHIPRTISRHLAPLLKRGFIEVEGEIVETPRDGNSRADVELRVIQLAALTSQPSPRNASNNKTSPSKRQHKNLMEALERAKEAAIRHTTAVKASTGHRLMHNFSTLIESVREQDEQILAADEKKFIAAFEACSTSAKCLFLRLYRRKGFVFRVCMLKGYGDVPNLPEAAAHLEAHGLACIVTPNDTKGLDWTGVADLLTAPELIAVASKCGHYLSMGSLSRDGILAVLQHIPPCRLLRLLAELAGDLIVLDQGSCVVVERLERLFFLNEGHDLALFLATDFGAIRYPDYEVYRTRGVFPSRMALLAYEEALEAATALTIALEDGGDERAVEQALTPAWSVLDRGLHKQQHSLEIPCFLRRYDASWIYCMMATAGVSMLERRKEYKDAVRRLRQLLDGRCCPSRRGDWYVRLSIDLEHLNKPSQALEVAEKALEDTSISSGDRLSLQRRVLRLGKPPRRWRLPYWAAAAAWEPREVRIIGRPLASIIGAKSVFYGMDEEPCSVEQLALQYYRCEEQGGWLGHHCEGGIWAMLFGILLWDCLFKPGIPDVFRTPFQTAPLDLNSAEFYGQREDSIKTVLTRISQGEADTLLDSVWHMHNGCLCRGVSWDRYSLEDLKVICDCIGGRGLSAVLKLLAEDHAGWQGGMPDLFLYSPERRCAKLAEVKGPRDRLSDQQRAWMRALDAAGLDVEVLKVVEP